MISTFKHSKYDNSFEARSDLRKVAYMSSVLTLLVGGHSEEDARQTIPRGIEQFAKKVPEVRDPSVLKMMLCQVEEQWQIQYGHELDTINDSDISIYGFDPECIYTEEW